MAYENIRRIRSFFLKSTVPTSPGSATYVRFTLQEWKCISTEGALEIENQMKGFAPGYWEELDKSPVTWWRQGDSIYFIQLGGWFVIPYVKAIQEQLQASLAEN
ncbi:MAG: hypothetical protein H6581_26260 [Bacteroidia bacterium]|nr:hypothetical protein [Bacteroidia bacterium]